MDILNDYVLPLAASPWIYAIAFVLIAVDGFFPPFPSESVVVALAALSASNGVPDIGPLLAVARRRGGCRRHRRLSRWPGDRPPPAAAAAVRARSPRLVGWAEAGLAARPGTLFLAARYIPLGRFGVNVTAGAVDYPFRRFLPWCNRRRRQLGRLYGAGRLCRRQVVRTAAAPRHGGRHHRRLRPGLAARPGDRTGADPVSAGGGTRGNSGAGRCGAITDLPRPCRRVSMRRGRGPLERQS